MPQGLSLGLLLCQPLCPKDSGLSMGLLLWHEVTVVTTVLTAVGPKDVLWGPLVPHGQSLGHLGSAQKTSCGHLGSAPRTSLGLFTSQKDTWLWHETLTATDKPRGQSLGHLLWQTVCPEDCPWGSCFGNCYAPWTVHGAPALATAMRHGLSLGLLLWQPLCPMDCTWGFCFDNRYAPRTVHGALAQIGKGSTLCLGYRCNHGTVRDSLFAIP